MTWPNPKGRRLVAPTDAMCVSSKLPRPIVAAMDRYAVHANLTRSAVMAEVLTLAFQEHVDDR